MVALSDLKGDTRLLTEIYLLRAGVLIQKLRKTGKIIDYYKKLKVAQIKLMRRVHFLEYNLAKPSLFRTFSPWWYKM
jgi:hypothetical protein